MKDFKRNNDLIFGLKLLCAFLIFAGYMLIFFILPLLFLTPLPIFVLMNFLIVAVGILLEILTLTEKTVFRIISNICSAVGLVYFFVLICCTFK